MGTTRQDVGVRRCELYAMCRLWAHLVMSYVFTAWVCYILFMEYKAIAALRLRFLCDEQRRPDQFTVRLFFYISHSPYCICSLSALRNLQSSC